MAFNNNEYILIQGWMINELNLKGNDLLIYAIIFRYSQDGIHRFYGSLQYLADWTNSTISGVQKNLKNLIESNLIIKNKVFSNGEVSRNEYFINTSILNSLQLSCNTNENNIQLSCSDMQLSCSDMQLSCNNNKYNNIYKNNLFISKDINKAKPQILEENIYFDEHKKSRSFKILKVWLSLYIKDESLRKTLINWLEVMYHNKKITNLECLKDKIDTLLESGLSTENQIKVVLDALDKVWFTFQYSINRVKKDIINNVNNSDIQLKQKDDDIELSNEVF